MLVGYSRIWLHITSFSRLQHSFRCEANCFLRCFFEYFFKYIFWVFTSVDVKPGGYWRLTVFPAPDLESGISPWGLVSFSLSFFLGVGHSTQKPKSRYYLMSSILFCSSFNIGWPLKTGCFMHTKWRRCIIFYEVLHFILFHSQLCTIWTLHFSSRCFALFTRTSRIRLIWLSIKKLFICFSSGEHSFLRQSTQVWGKHQKSK